MTPLAAAGLTGAAHQPLADGTAKPKFLFGACQGLDRAAKMKAAGFDFIELGVGGTLRPNDSDEAFKPQLEKLLASPLPIRSCNGFLPGNLKLTGPETFHDQALDYAEKACRRADMINMTRQVAVFCFQIGDGVTNLIYPTMGGLLAMLALVRVPFDRWFRFAWPLMLKLMIASALALVIAVWLGYA